MSVMHCPLCIGLAVLSIGRAMAHLNLVALMVWPNWHANRESSGMVIPTTLHSL